MYGRAALAKSVNLFFVYEEVVEQVNMICMGGSRHATVVVRKKADRTQVYVLHSMERRERQ